MAINYGNIQRNIIRFYELKAMVERKTSFDDDGETQLFNTVIYTEMPCRLSQRQLQANDQTPTTNNINYQIKIFYPPDYLINQGDQITIVDSELQRWSNRVFRAGTPMLYPSHSEALVEDWRYA